MLPMSAEKIINTDDVNFIISNANKVNEDKITGAVDINQLLARIRKEKSEENKTSLFFFGLFAALILVVGLLLSL
tara:strand:- start:73 stop:297 length:225 start_codon:yes stop_codon:yes gene_type:complete